MHIGVHRQYRRLKLALQGSRKVNGRVVSIFYGMLGSVLCGEGEPISRDEALRFWSELPARFRAIQARHPSVTAAEVAKVRGKIAARIPKPTRASERESYEPAERVVKR
jgi:hypothetical protein